MENEEVQLPPINAFVPEPVDEPEAAVLAEDAVSEPPSSASVREKNDREEPLMNLPMSKIKKIVKLDPEHISSTESANFVLGLATEMFIKQFAIDSSEMTKSKGRKKIMYSDAQKVVSSVDIYSFMRDLVPKRAPIGELVSRGLIKLRPGDQQRIEASLMKNGYTDLDEAETRDDDDEEEVEEVASKEGTEDIEEIGSKSVGEDTEDVEEIDEPIQDLGDGDGDGDIEMEDQENIEIIDDDL